MKRNLLLIFLIIIMSLSVVGCSTEKSTNEDSISYNVLSENNLNEDIQASLDYIKELRGYGIIKEKDNNYIMYIGLGEKATGGYSIKIKSVEKIKKGLKITINEIKPKDNQMVTETLTYPNILIEIPKNIDINNINVITTDGEQLPNINKENE